MPWPPEAANCIYGASGVVYSQSPELLVAPTNVTVTCPSDVPAAVTTLAGLIGQGGYFSDPTGTVSSLDNTNLTMNGVILRTYQVANACGVSTYAVQTITVDNTNPPTIAYLPNIVQGVDPGQTNATVYYTPTATDYCGDVVAPASIVATPPSGSQFPIGTNTVTVVATDIDGNSATDTFTVAVIGLPTT